MVLVPYLQYDYCIVCHSSLNNMNNNNQLSISSFILLFSPLLLPGSFIFLYKYFASACFAHGTAQQVATHTHSRTKKFGSF